MEQETLKWIATQGGGVLLAIVFAYFYRQDHQAVVSLQKDTTAALIANTAAMTKLGEAVDRSAARQAGR
jgi:hypothetical protein